ncbi:MAG: sn-glycerol-1-phosphate dehydrogenase [Ruminococcaceae bacterium]|nr:sn-glycerol-1-phosphate dehydrogenase [Oscillospiraceae bacterium]
MEKTSVNKTSLTALLAQDGFSCTCGRKHYGLLKDCAIGRNAIPDSLIPFLEKYNIRHPFILCDGNTFRAAGEQVTALLNRAGIPYTLHCIGREKPAPDEKIVGEAVMFCDAACDGVLAVGGGVINDTGKILAGMAGIPDIYIATAPSMDGFASATSSMERAGLKVSLPSRCPDAVIGDAAVLASAPTEMIRSGVGDMIAKYISLAEWEIAHLLIGEYFCPVVADMVREALDTCAREAEAAVNGDENAVCRLTEALVLSGMAMNYAGLSRPASGMEHYISHIIDMQALEFGTPSSFHGIQCGVGTLLTLQAYEKLRTVTPDKEKALAHAASFSLREHEARLRTQLGKGAESMITGEAKEGKYDPAKHEKRLDKILSVWDEILTIAAKLPSSAELTAFLAKIGHPTSGTAFGITEDAMREAFVLAKDIRDKYVLGRLLWDLGILDETAAELQM